MCYLRGRVGCQALPNGRAFSGEPSERSERPERKRGRRDRCNAMIDGTHEVTW
jgi:hypothetical protein